MGVDLREENKGWALRLLSLGSLCGRSGSKSGHVLLTFAPNMILSGFREKGVEWPLPLDFLSSLHVSAYPSLPCVLDVDGAGPD